MKPVMVIKGHESFDSRFEFFDILVLLEIDLFIFESSEESLDGDVVNTTSLAVHRNGDLVLFE
jgi:hypothetical protein